MRLLACSDLHCDIEATRRIRAEAAQADVVIVAGDLATEGQGAGPLLDVLRTIPRPVILVAGNHDRLAELRDVCRDWRDGHVLQGQGLRLNGVAFFGLGAEIPRRHTAAWNFALSEVQATRALADCPPGAVLITHSPPRGVVDRRKEGTHDGSTAVMAAIQRCQPRLHLCGHIHDAFGQSADVGGCPVHNLGPTPRWFEL